jgi:hypothetical protein
MNGYSNNGFTQSLNGILSLTDGLGTTIENGTITTGDISGDDIVSNTVTTTTLKSTDLELSGNLTIDNNLTVDGLTTLQNTNINNNLTVQNGDLLMTNNNMVKIQCNNIQNYNNKKYLTEDNFYGDGIAVDVGFNNIATGNVQSANINVSNDVTAINIKTTNLNVLNNLYINGVLYKNHYNVGNLYIGSLNNLCLPLSNGSINYLALYFQGLDLQIFLINAYTDNYVILNPNYMIVFYYNDTILQIIDNTNGYNMIYSNIKFNYNFICSKILIYYKNIQI